MPLLAVPNTLMYLPKQPQLQPQLQTVKILKLPHAYKAPKYKSAEAAGMDIYAAEDVSIPFNSVRTIATGFKIILPKGTVGLIKARSGMYSKHLIEVDGVIDSDYRGEVFVMLHNTNSFTHVTDFQIKRGERIAQMVITQLPKMTTEYISEEEFNSIEHKTVRGANGFGSTGMGD